MTSKTPDRPQVHAERVLLEACLSFDDRLKAFIKDARNDEHVVHAAARALFEVRRLENAINEDAHPAMTAVPVIPSVDKENL
ncbi:hypothetical protein [Thiomonas sp.]